MRDSTLTTLIVTLVGPAAAHNAEHLARDPPSPEIFASIAVEFGLISAALFFYWRGTIGAAFMSVAVTLGAAVLWFAHVSPDAEQSVARIAANYTDPMARAVAAGIVYALMASLMATALYAASQVVAQGRKG
jgi:hypothetical protein